MIKVIIEGVVYDLASLYVIERTTKTGEKKRL